MTFPYIIKPMETESEICGKADVHYRSWHETYAGLVDEEYLVRITPEKCLDIARKWPENLIVAKDGEKVIGFVGYGKYRDESIPDCGEVFSIYVLAEYHGRGVGYALMNAAAEQLTGFGKIALWVLKGNEKAIRFYERYGFRFDGTEAPIKLGTYNTELRMVFERK